MELLELSKVLKEHMEAGGTFEIQINSNNLDVTISRRNTGIELGDLYFSECNAIMTSSEDVLLTFGNMNAQPISVKEDGKKIYPMEINSGLTIDLSMVEALEEVTDIDDWFVFPPCRIINLYMVSEDGNVGGHRDIVTVGFI